MTKPLSYDANVHALAPKLTAAYVAIDPVTAARWLAENTVNRPIRAVKIDQYGRDMLAGRWNASESTLCFSPDGKLQNGQHRLTAIVKTGVTVVMLVQRNVPTAAMRTMDTGSARTIGDVLGFAKEISAHLLGSTLKTCLLVSDGRIYRDNKVQGTSHEELLAFLAANPDVRESVRLSRRWSSVDAPPTTKASAHWLISRVAGDELATHYFDQLTSRANEPHGSAVLAVDSRLRQVRAMRAMYPTRNFVYLLVKGWNHYARGASVRTLAMTPKGEFRIPQPVPWQR